MESILYEIEIIARPYSVYRGANKWRSKREACLSHSSTVSSDGTNVVVFRENSGILDYYPITSLIKRVEIKRNPVYYRFSTMLWNVVNPGNLKMISREVHDIIVSTLYKFHPQSLGNPGLVEAYSRIDNSIDFSGSSGLIFSEFYDALFEMTDGLAKSALVSEYCRVIQNTVKGLRASALFCSLNLYNKRHLKDTKKPSYFPWMISLIRSITPSETSKLLPDIAKPVKERTKEKGSKSALFKYASFVDLRNRKEDRFNSFASLIDLNKKRRSPVRLVEPGKGKQRTRKNFESFELRGLKASLSPIRGIIFD